MGAEALRKSMGCDEIPRELFNLRYETSWTAAVTRRKLKQNTAGMNIIIGIIDIYWNKLLHCDPKLEDHTAPF